MAKQSAYAARVIGTLDRIGQQMGQANWPVHLRVLLKLTQCLQGNFQKRKIQSQQIVDRPVCLCKPPQNGLIIFVGRGNRRIR